MSEEKRTRECAAHPDALRCAHYRSVSGERIATLHRADVGWSVIGIGTIADFNPCPQPEVVWRLSSDAATDLFDEVSRRWVLEGAVILPRGTRP